MLAYNIVWC